MAISVDPVEKSRALADSLGLSFPILSDPALEVIRRYGVADEENGISWPALFLVMSNARVAWRDLSETYKIRPTVEEMLSHLDAATDAKAGSDRPPR